MLWRHETRGPQHQSGLGFAGVCNAGDTKVSHLDGIALGLVHDVGGLDVTVYDVLLVGIRQGLGYAGNNAQHNGDRQQLVPLAVVGQILAFQELHGDVGKVMLFAGIKNRHNILVL